MKELLKKYLGSETRRKLVALLYAPHLPFDALYFFLKGVRWHWSWRVRGWPLLSQSKRYQISIGKHAILTSDPKWNTIGVFQKTTIKAVGPSARIEIGENVQMSGVTISARDLIKIGDDVLLGSGVLITDNDGHPIDPFAREHGEVKVSPVIIEDRAFIGARSMLLKGVHIGEGAVVGAGSVVVKGVAPFTIVGGNPSKEIGCSRSDAT